MRLVALLAPQVHAGMSAKAPRTCKNHRYLWGFRLIRAGRYAQRDSKVSRHEGQCLDDVVRSSSLGLESQFGNGGLNRSSATGEQATNRQKVLTTMAWRRSR